MNELGQRSVKPLRHGIPYMLAMGIMSTGLAMVEFITNNMIPITLRHFTDNTIFIAGAIALNRLFGFMVQPYVAYKSDRMTRFGRRRPYLAAGLSLTACFLLLLGAFPAIFTGESRHLTSTLVLLFGVNVCLQVCQDINFGSETPLYPDTFSRNMLGRAFSFRTTITALMTLFMLNFAMRWADRNEFYPYLCAAGSLGVSLAIVLFIIRENPSVNTNRPRERYNPIRHLKLFRENSDYVKVAIIAAAGLMLEAAFAVFHPLFVTETLGFSKTDFGRAMTLGPFITMAFALPSGWLTDRLGPKRMMMAGFTLAMIASAGMLFVVKGFISLLVVCTIQATAATLYMIAAFPLVFQYAPRGECGRIFGLVQYVRASSAFVITPVIGVLARWFHSYKTGYATCVVLGLVGILTALSLRTAPQRTDFEQIEDAG